MAYYVTLKINKTFISIKSGQLDQKNKPCIQGCLTVCVHIMILGCVAINLFMYA